METNPGNGQMDMAALLLMMKNNPNLLNQLTALQASQNQNQTQQQEIVNDRRQRNEERRKAKALPIYHKREEIMNFVKENKFTIVVGDTGCGKSTQLPQYLFEEYEGKKNAKILWVLPRKLPAITLSERVCEEMEIAEGQEIGYEVPNKKKCSDKTMLKFVTDIVLINELIEKREKFGDDYYSKLGYSMIVLDEVHERNLYTDILLASLKNICEESRMKMLVTSATINEKVFEDYFGVKAIHVDGRPYPVEIDYNPIPESNDNLNLQISGFAHIRHMLLCIKRIAKRIEEEEDFPYKGHILVFTSGVDDINRLLAALQDEVSDKFEVLPLHGLLRPEEQKTVFRTVEGLNKIILSTRMAETALTIDGVRVVIDIGFDKESVYDAVKRMTIIENRFIPQSSAKQRTGRAGRTSPGLCIRLYTEEKFKLLSRNKISEIQRMDLGKVVLKLKAMGEDDVVKFDFVEKPAEGLLQQTVTHLTELGALNKQSGNLTDIGNAMLQLDTDPDYSKVILEGLHRGCVHEVIDIIAMAGVNYRLFTRGFDDNTKENADKVKFDIVNGKGDLLTFLDLFRAWVEKKSKGDQEKWCKSLYLRSSAFYDALKTVRDLERSLEKAQAILQKSRAAPTKKNYEMKTDEVIAMRSVLIPEGPKKEKLEDDITKCFLTAFYPNVCVYTGIPQLGYALLRDDMILKIHGSSSMALLQENPQYVICLDINKAAYNNAKIVTKVEKKWFEELFPKYEADGNLKFLSKTYNFQKFIIPRLGRQILRFFVDQKNPEIQDIAETTEHSFFVDFREEMLVGYTSSGKMEHVRQKMMDILSEIHEQLADETREYSMTLSTRAIFQAGGEIRDILLNNEAVSVAFDGFDAAHWDDANLYKMFKKRAKIARIELNEVDQSTQLRHGVVRFDSQKDAEKVMKYYKSEKELAVFKAKESEIVPSLSLLKSAARSRAQRAFRARIEWYTGVSEKSAHLSFLNPQRADLFYQKVKLKKPKLRGRDVFVNEDLMILQNDSGVDGVILKKVSREKNLVLHKLTSDIDEIDINDMIKEYDLEKAFVGVKVFRESEITLLAPETLTPEIYTELIRHQLIEKVGLDAAEILRIEPYKPRQPKENPNGMAENPHVDHRRFVDVDVFDLSTARKIINFFEGREDFSVLTHGRMHCRLNFTKSRTLNQYLYRKIQKEVSNTIESLQEKWGNSVMIRESIEASDQGKARNRAVVRIVATDPLALDECCKVLDPLLNGTPFFFRTLAQLRKSKKPDTRTKMEQIEAKYDVSIILLAKLLKVIGESDAKEKAMEEVAEFFNEVEKKEWIKAVVGFKHRPIRHILENEGKALTDIEEKYTVKNGSGALTRNLKITYSLVFKEIIIMGKENNISKALEEVRALVNKFAEKDHLDDNKCPICLAEIVEGYRLQICGHKYCFTCLEDELEERLNNNPEFPFCCSKCKTKAEEEKSEEFEVKPICFRDLLNIFASDRLHVLYQRSLENYLKKNTDKYFNCYSPNCPQIFRHSEDEQEFSCDYCLKNYCKECKKIAHGQTECKDAEKERIIEGFKRDGIEYRECPGCGEFFIKVEGCDKVHCESCQAIFCWFCGEEFKTDNEAYHHLQDVHKNSGLLDYPWDYNDNFD